MTKRAGELHLNAFLMGVGHHEAAWRLPESDPHANTDIEHFKKLARTAERGKLDSLFLADSPVLWNDLGRRPGGTLEPTVVLTALAGVTEHVGLIATASTTFEPAYTIARRFASLDHISEGRAGWNIVTTSNPDAAQNFGMDDQMAHDERYARARAFPIIPCKLCGSNENAQRRQVKEMLAAWEREYPGRTESIFSALRNVEPGHLADPAVFDFRGLDRKEPDGEPPEAAR